MKKLFLILLLCLPLTAKAQNAAYSDIVLSGSGRPIAGANVSVCSTPGLATTAASVTSNIAVLTFGSSPITAGFAAGMTLQVSGFTGGDTYFNGGTLSGGVITGGFTILSVTSTTVSFALTHTNASAGTNGSAFQQGNSITSCAPLASITSDSAGLVPITQPGLTTDGLGNYSFYAAPNNFMVQFSGASITLKLKPVNLACSGSANCTLTGNNTHSGTETFTGGVTINGGTTVVANNTVNLQASNIVFGTTNASIGGSTAAFIGGIPVISSGFGTSPSMVTTNDSISFVINVGTGGVAQTGVIGFPVAAASGWHVFCQDITTFSTTVFLTRETATTTGTATIGNFNSSAVAAPWASGDNLFCIAVAR